MSDKAGSTCTCDLTISNREPLEYWLHQAYAANLHHRPMQNRAELAQALSAIAEHEPSSVLEVGSWWGATLFLFSRVAANGALLIGVDRNFCGMAPFAFNGLYPGQEVHFILGNSHREPTPSKVKRLLGDRPLDFVFLDGSHQRDGLEMDLATYGPLIPKGGLIGIHDIDPAGGWPEAVGFWETHKRAYATFQEFIDRKATKGDRERMPAGFGLLEV